MTRGEVSGFEQRDDRKLGHMRAMVERMAGGLKVITVINGKRGRHRHAQHARRQ